MENSDNTKSEQELNKKYPLPVYPPSEDIYARGKEETEIDPEDISRTKPRDIPEGKNVKDFNVDLSGSDLDIPGAELDDEQEAVGSEDEENNGYSLGGDNHHEQEEDNADTVN